MLLENTAFQGLLDRIVELFLASNNLAADSPDAACAYGGAGPGGADTGHRKARYQAQISCPQRELGQLLGNTKASIPGTAVKLIELGDILSEARSLYQHLYTPPPDVIDLAAVNSVFKNNIPVEVKLREADADRLIEPLSITDPFIPCWIIVPTTAHLLVWMV
ncbi:hypothetical protein HMPREF1544_12163 [Mucor circinelloides 1006PhL]|uniref:Uncharacterized protein n=1 Tax=Mucor circinelloides f. circinelloides (strain 1006PhL) TaxID=1220926 RepID=S2IU16_MUCC1|nr:hypothetical protein HMPREF1544_12163 [Mucor circinelloides 1006PhL]